MGHLGKRKKETRGKKECRGTKKVFRKLKRQVKLSKEFLWAKFLRGGIAQKKEEKRQVGGGGVGRRFSRNVQKGGKTLTYRLDERTKKEKDRCETWGFG